MVSLPKSRSYNWFYMRRSKVWIGIKRDHEEETLGLRGSIQWHQLRKGQLRKIIYCANYRHDVPDSL
jgi:hypothetical protein